MIRACTIKLCPDMYRLKREPNLDEALSFMRKRSTHSAIVHADNVQHDTNTNKFDLVPSICSTRLLPSRQVLSTVERPTH